MPRGLAFVATLVAALAASAASCSRRSAPPHVLLITIDTLRADRVGCYGDQSGATPVLDQLCAESVRFDPALSPAPLTLPAHATIMSGLLPPAHGVRNNGPFQLAAGLTTIAEVATAHGYDTAAFVAALPLERRTGLDQGFAVYDDSLPPGRGDFGYAERPARDVLDRAAAWWQQQSRPRFLWVHLFEPHDPYEPPPDVRDRFPEDLYRGEIFAVDREVGRFFARLKERGDWHDTIVAVTADHGESLGEHGEQTHGLLPYESTLRVPLIIKPSEGSSSRVRPGLQGPATLADLGATLLDLTGLPAQGLHGRSLLDAAARGSFEAYGEAVAPALDFNWAPLFTLRRDTWRLVAGPKGQAASTGVALYDLASDPHETRNVASQYPERRDRLLVSLERLRTAPAPAGPVEAGRAIDGATRDRLAALGYAAGGGTTSAISTNGPHPADMLWVAETLNQASDLRPESINASITRLEQLARHDPGSHLIARRLATAYQRRGRYAAAARAYKRAHDLGYRDDRLVREAIDLYIRAAAAEDAAGRARAAWILLTEARALDANAIELREARATWLARQGRMSDARTELEQLVRDAPARASAWRQLGLVHLKAQRLAAAIEALETARQLAADPDTLFALGEARFLSGDRSRSAEAFRAYLSIARAEDAARKRHAELRLR